MEACGFRDTNEDFKKLGAVVVGVSVDSVEEQKKFAEKEKLNFILLADSEKKVSKSYGVLGEKGYANRVTFLIDPEGKIEKIYPKVDPKTHSAEILKDLAQLVGYEEN